MGLLDKDKEETATPSQDLSDDDKLAMALIALATTGVGGLVGGRQGAMSGAIAGGKGAGMVAQDAADKQKKAEEIGQKATADAKARKLALDDKFAVVDYENKNKKPEPPKLMTNAKGQIVSIDPATNQSVVVDSSTKPVADPMSGFKFDKAVDSAGKELSSHGKLFSAINMVEKELGFPLDNINDKGQVKQPDGSFKDVDLPGANVWGIGRVTAHSPEARMLEGSVAAIFNTELKDRSGAAVTDNELNRLKMEFNAGKFNTEPEMLRALKRYKIKAAEVLANAEARYNPEVLAEYSNRGGFTSGKLGGETGGATGQWDAPPTPEEARAEIERRKAATAKK